MLLVTRVTMTESKVCVYSEQHPPFVHIFFFFFNKALLHKERTGQTNLSGIMMRRDCILYSDSQKVCLSAVSERNKRVLYGMFLQVGV